MNPVIGTKFRMKGGDHMAALLEQYRVVEVGGKHVGAGANAADHGSTNEDCLRGMPVDVDLGDAAINLAAVGVAFDRKIEQSERRLGRIENL